jgi:predicted small metal-binding protein
MKTMTIKIECSSLGIKDCEFTATGETPGEVVEEMIEHLRSKHDLDMPDADTILNGELNSSSIGDANSAVSVIVKRLREALNITESTESTESIEIESPKPTIGRTTSA